jgi:hypothetical protein
MIGRFIPKGNSLWYPLDRRMGGSPELVLTWWWRMNFPSLQLSGLNPGRPVCSLIYFPGLNRPWNTIHCSLSTQHIRLIVVYLVYPKISGLAACSENCKWYTAIRCGCIAILWVSLVNFAAITLCVATQRVFIVVSVYFVIDSVRKLLDTPS